MNKVDLPKDKNKLIDQKMLETEKYCNANKKPACRTAAVN